MANVKNRKKKKKSMSNLEKVTLIVTAVDDLHKSEECLRRLYTSFGRRKIEILDMANAIKHDKEKLIKKGTTLGIEWRHDDGKGFVSDMYIATYKGSWVLPEQARSISQLLKNK